MANARRDAFLVFNGEIYNHPELRRELAGRGHRFRSSSDTEVVLAAYDEWGPDCVQRFNGMWALAVWDQRRRRLFCSRDRFGIKPFYYFLDDDQLVFGSEVKAVLQGMPGSPSPHYPTIRAYLSPGLLCHRAETFFAGVKRLPPAHNLVVSAERAELTRYWDYDAPMERHDTRHADERFAALLDDAVRLRLRGDVAVGVALSGGIDSTAVTALARRHLDGAPLEVFTAAFPGAAFDELRWAKLAAARTGAELHVAEYRPTNLLADLARVIWHLDYPAIASQVLPRWQLMGLAAEHVKVVLEGQGSDEMLGGYLKRYFVPWALDTVGDLASRRLPRAARDLASATLATYRRYGAAPLRDTVERALPVLLRARRARSFSAAVLADDFRASTDGSPPPHAVAAPRYPDRLTRTLHDDHARAILPHLLKFGDAISMGHSLEARLPFLDHRLVELVFQLPPDHKFDGKTSKILLKRSLKDVLPPEIVARRDKIGFATPIADWLRARLDAEVRPLLLSARARGRGIFDAARLERALARLGRGGEGSGELAFRWVSVELWFKLFIDGAAPARPDSAVAPRG